MGRVTKISHEDTPQHFFFSEETTESVEARKLDAKLEPVKVYAKKNKDITASFKEGKAFSMKLGENRLHDVHVYDDCVKYYLNGEVIATSKLEMQREVDGKWTAYSMTSGLQQAVKAVSKVDTKKTVDITSDLKYGDRELNLEVDWVGGDALSAKQTFVAKAPGKTIRLVWIIERLTNDEFVLDTSDYKGAIEDTGWVDYYITELPEIDSGEDPKQVWDSATRRIIFEPKGIEDELIVDPSLRLTSESGYYLTVCDGFCVRLSTVNTSIIAWRVAKADNSTVLSYGYSRVATAAGTFYLTYAGDLSVEVLQDTDQLVIIQQSGVPNLASAGSSTDLLSDAGGADTVTFVQRFYIYKDRINIVIYPLFTTGTYYTATNTTTNSWIYVDDNSLDGVANVYEGSGIELNGTSVTVSSAKYLGYTADLENVSVSTVDSSAGSGGTATLAQSLGGAGTTLLSMLNGNVKAGAYMIAQINIDSAERENEATPGTFDVWATATAYTAGDIFERLGLRWIVKDDHTSSAWPTGIEKLTNGTFADASVPSTWTGSAPASLVGWGNAGTPDASNICTISSGECTLVSDGTYTGIYQNILTIGKLYSYSIVVSDVTSGALAINGPATQINMTSVDTYTGFFMAIATSFTLKRKQAEATNVTFGSVTIKEVTAPSQILEYRMTLGNNAADTTFVPGTGTTPTDLNYPRLINNLSADGVFPVNMASEIIEMEMDTDRIEPQFRVADYPVKYGASGTEPLIFSWDCADANGYKWVDGVPTVIAGTDTGGSYLSDGINGKAFDTVGGTKNIKFAVSAGEDIFDRDEGMMIIKCKVFDWTTTRSIFGIGNDNNQYNIYIHGGNTKFSFSSEHDSEGTEYESEDRNRTDLDSWHTVIMMWKDLKTTSGRIAWVVDTGHDGWNAKTTAATEWESGEDMYFGAGRSGGAEGLDCLIDSVKIYSKCIYPSQGGYLDRHNGFQNADNKVLMAWFCDSATVDYQRGDNSDVATATPSGAGIITANGVLCDAASETCTFPCTEGNSMEGAKGTIEFDFTETGTTGNYDVFFDHSVANAFRIQRGDLDTRVQFYISNDFSVFYSVSNIFDGLKHHMKFTWERNADGDCIRRVYTDGVLEGTDTGAFTVPTLTSGTMYVGSKSDGTLQINGTISNFIITNDPDGDSHPCTFDGEEIHRPRLIKT